MNIFLILLSLSISPVNAHEKVSLFKGKDLSAFDKVGDANWSIKKGFVTANTGSGFLVTKKSYDNYQLKLEFWAEKGTNSGIFFRCAEIIKFQTCYEANIFDTRPDQTYRTGSLVNVAPPKKKINTENGKWHKFEISAQGPEIRVKLDGVETVSIKDTQYAVGPIALQFAGGKGVKFRNMWLEKKAVR